MRSETLLRAPDGGPIYTETDFGRPIAEPFNALSAALFFGIALYWTWRVRGAVRTHVFVAIASFVLAVGAVGGTLYHALRVWRGFLVMDFVPILLLSVAASAYFTRRLLASTFRATIVVGLVTLLHVAFFSAVRAGRLPIPLPLAINASYAMLGLVVALPIAVYAVRIRGEAPRRFVFALVAFGIALFFRAADAFPEPLLPMGTHFLWHVFGALAVHQCFALVYGAEERGRTMPTIGSVTQV